VIGVKSSYELESGEIFLIGFIIRTVINALALLVIANLSDGHIVVRGFVTAVLVALVLGLANAVVTPILYAVAKAMTCVLTCVTLGLWSLILSWLINGLLFWGAAQLIEGFRVTDFWAALWGALALSIVNALATVFTRREEDNN
jgi:putative membrane protein